MLKKNALPLPLLILLVVFAGFAFHGVNGLSFGVEFEKRSARVTKKSAFWGRVANAVSGCAQLPDEQIVAGNATASTRRHLAGRDGLSTHNAIAPSACRIHYTDDSAVHFPYFVEGVYVPKTIGREITIHTVYQPLAEAMPNLRSPPCLPFPEPHATAS